MTTEQLEHIPTGDLIPYARNSRAHSEQQVTQLAASIHEFGFCAPILIDEASQIIAGHGRVMAAQKLKLKTVPCRRLEHLSEAQKRAYVIADNRLAENATWDEELLTNELSDLYADDFDVELLGFEADELESLLGLEPNKGEIIEDEVPEPPADPVTQPGDLWLLGDHRLLCGDSTKAEDVERLMNGAKAGMVFTDPPYGIGFQSNYRTKTPQFDEIANDKTILQIDSLLFDNMKENTAAYICTRWDVYAEWFNQFATKFAIKNCIVWYKKGGGLGDLVNSFLPNHEFFIVAHKGMAPLIGKRKADVWDIKRDSFNSYKHPTQKPVAVSSEAIQSHCKNEEIVFDPFLGSGTTLIAAEQLNRKCYGMEISPQYCDVIIQRWEKLTGNKATKE